MTQNTSLVGKEVLLYKNLARSGFNLADPETKEVLALDLSYVFLSQVSFLVDEDRRQEMLKTREGIVHAWAKGILTSCLPFKTRIPVEIFDTYTHFKELTYHPYENGYFFLKETKEKMETASQLIGYYNLIRVLPTL